MALATSLQGGRDSRAHPQPSLLPTCSRARGHEGVQMALCPWMGPSSADRGGSSWAACLLHWQLGITLKLPAPIPNGVNGSGGGSVGEQEADSHATSCWLAAGTAVTADVAVGISQPARQCHWGWPHMRGRKGPLYSLIIPHDAACSWCSRKCWSASCPGTGMFSPSSQPGTFAGSSLLAGCGGGSGTPLAPSWNGCVAVPAVHSSVPSAPERAAATNSQHPENSSARRYACLTWSYKCCLSLELKNNFFSVRWGYLQWEHMGLCSKAILSLFLWGDSFR